MNYCLLVNEAAASEQELMLLELIAARCVDWTNCKLTYAACLETRNELMTPATHRIADEAREKACQSLAKFRRAVELHRQFAEGRQTEPALAQ